MTTAAEQAGRLGLKALGNRPEWRGTCPLCGYPDAFALSERNGRTLAWCFACQDKAAIAAWNNGREPAQPSRLVTSDRAGRALEQKARACNFWNGAVPCSGTPAASYLANRTLSEFVASPALRFRCDLRHPKLPGFWPAMIGEAVDVNGNTLGIHRTYLNADGSGKADIGVPKASLGQIWGGAIRLNPIAEEIVIGEGIESSASAGLLLRLPAWAAVSSGNLGDGLALPIEVRSIVIAADHDTAGLKAAYRAAARWRAEGRHVRIEVPPIQGWDFNDVLCKGGTSYGGH